MKKVTRRQKKQLALLTLIVLIASIVAIMFLTPVFDIKKIEVKGESFLSEEEIITIGGVRTGVNIFSVNADKIEDSINEDSYIKSVKVSRSLPSTLVITVEEEVGVAYLNGEDGFVIIAEDGKCIEVTDGTKNVGESGKVTSAPNLPKVTGLGNVSYKVGEEITAEDSVKLDAFLRCLHEFAKYKYVFNMVEIDVTNINDIKFYYNNKKLCVSMGKYESKDIGHRMELFGKIYQSVVEKTKEGEMPSGYINLGRQYYNPKGENAGKPQEKEEKPKAEGEKTETEGEKTE